MIVQVSVLARGAGDKGLPDAALSIPCGSGRQPLRWLACAACSRMALARGDVLTSYIPQAIKSADGAVMDADALVNEVLEDHASVTVEYAAGPLAFRARWEGRPPTPKQEWADLAAGSHDPQAWLDTLDLHAYGVDKLVAEELALRGPEASGAAEVGAELARVKDVLAQRAGALQALFLWYSGQGEELADKDFGAMALDAFSKLLLDARIPSEKYSVLSAEAAFQRALLQKKGPREHTLKLPDFLAALLAVAAGKLKPGLEGEGEGHALLADKVAALADRFLLAHAGPGLVARLEDVADACSQQAQAALEEVAPAVAACFASARVRRSAPCDARTRIPIRALLPHIQKWELLGSTHSLGLTALLSIHAMQPSPSLDQLRICSCPFEVNLQEFKRFLLGAAYHAYNVSASDKAFATVFLPKFLRGLFERAGVTVERSQKV